MTGCFRESDKGGKEVGFGGWVSGGWLVGWFGENQCKWWQVDNILLQNIGPITYTY